MEGGGSLPYLIKEAALGRVIDEVGHRYGKLVVIERATNKGGYASWLCKCACGNETIVSGSFLRRGDTKSCGCLKREIMKTRLIDRTGCRYGRLTVLSQAESINHHTRWLCRCDCGNETEVFADGLQSGGTKSCGCLRSERTRETHSLPAGIAAFNSLIHHMKYEAKKRGHAWGITKEQVRILTQQLCYYCGAQPIQQGTSSTCNGAYIYNGIDRINNDEGYLTMNVVSCCGTCNWAKHAMTQDEFFSWVSRIYKYSVSKEK